MRTIAKDKASPAVSESGSPAEGKENWFRTHWCMVTFCVIALLAFVLRFVFAYGPSVDDSFALSGGTTASSHHRIIVEILYGTYDPASQGSLNYPYGIESIFGPLFDYCCAAWAKLFSAFGASYPDAANMALAVNPPIFGALTCIPVFLIAKRFFKDNVIGLVAAGFYAVFPILIMTTPFSYGSELPFVSFLMAGLVFFVVSAFDNVDKCGVTDIKGVFTQKPVVLWVALAALFMTFIVYSWTGFWAIVMASSVMLLFALIFDRIGGRAIAANVGIFIAVIAVPVCLGAIYYCIIGAWDSVLSGGFTLAIIASVLAVLFLLLEKKPWVFTIPGLLVLIGIIAAVLHFAVPDLASAVYSGNDAYVGALMSDLIVEGNRTTISAMASYYGWVTVWFPLIFGVWMAIRYREHAKSKAYTFVMLWLFAGFFACWFNTEYAVITGAVFSVASAAAIVGIFRFVDLKSYFRSLKGNGFKAGAKKALNFFPFVTVLVAVFLVAAPAAVYAIDAATPTNDEPIDYFGGLGYTINTSDSSIVNSAWSGFTPTKEPTLVTWYGYSDTASSVGGYKTVTSSTGAGTSVMSSTYLSEGSKEVLATLIIRLVEENASAYSTVFAAAGVGDLVNYVDDDNAARAYIKDHKADFAGYNAKPSAENLPYLAGVHYLAAALDESEMAALYDDVRAATHKEINYIELDGSMLPLYYGDSSIANYLGYFGDLAIGGTYSTPSKLFYVDSQTAQFYQWGYYPSLYYSYTDSMYATFLWNALIGTTPAEHGFSSSLELLSALASSDGSVKATPLAGIENFDLAYWHVNYQAKDSSKWVDMDIDDALALQKANGGIINYLSSVIILEYNPTASVYEEVTVTGASDYSGIRVAVFEELQAGDKGYDPNGNNLVQRSTAFVDPVTGKANIAHPVSNYLVKYYVGATNLYDGTLLKTESAVGTYDLPIISTQTGVLVDADGNALSNSGARLVFTGSNNEPFDVAVDAAGSFTLNDVQPDRYAVEVFSASDVRLNTVILTLSNADGAPLDGLTVSAGAFRLTINVNDRYGVPLADSVNVVITDASGSSFSTEVADGKAVLPVLSGKYTISIEDIANEYVSVASSSVSVTKDASTTLTAYPADVIGSCSNGTAIMALGYANVVVGGNAVVPVSLKGAVTTYQLISATEAKINGTSTAVVKVDGVLKNGSSKVAGTVTYISTADGSVFTFMSNADGEFVAHIPAGEYTVYATNNSNLAYLATETVAAGDAEYSLSTAYAMTQYVRGDVGSTKGIGYIPLDFTVDGKTVPAVTGTDGTFKLYVPSGKAVSVKIAKESFAGYSEFTVGNDYTKNISDTMTSTKYDYFTIPADEGANHVNPAHVTFNTGVTNSIKFLFEYGSKSFEKDIADGASVEIPSGSHTITFVSMTDTSDDSVYYIKKSVTIYPSTTEVDLSDIFKCESVVITKVNSTDKITIDTVEASETEKSVQSETKKDNKNIVTYYFPVDGTYYITITNDKGDKMVRYGTDVALIEDYDQFFKEVVKFSGFVGSKVTGTILVTDDAGDKYLVTVKDGEYSFNVVKGIVISTMILDASATPDNGEWKYSISGESLLDLAPLTIDEDTVANFLVATTSVDKAENDVFDSVKIDGTMDAGKFQGLTLTAKRKDASSAPAATYLITAGAGLELNQYYVLRFAEHQETSSVAVDGIYNQYAIGAANASASLTISTLDGKEVKTIVIPGKCYGVGSVAPVVGDCLSTMDGFAYKYALTFDNDSKNLYKVSITSISSTSSDYNIAVVDASGYLVREVGSTETYDIAGYGSTTVYVAFMKKSESVTTEIPESLIIQYELFAVNNDDAGTLVSIGSGSEEVDRAYAQLSISGATVSGNNADNDKETVSTGFWIITVFTILLLLLLVWGGMKRGVFSRRN